MAATVHIMRWTGDPSSPTKTSIESINTVANAVDKHQETAATSDNPIKIPESGTHYSYWVSTRLSASVAPSGTINNIRWYTDGTNNFDTGVGCNVAKANSYDQADGIEGTTGNDLSTHSDLDGSVVNAFTYKSPDSGTPLSVTGSLTGPNTGDFGQFVVYQITVNNTASAGATNPERFTWLYDET